MSSRRTPKATLSALLALLGCQSMGEVARTGSLDEVRVAIEKGADVNRPDRKTGATPLMLAIAENPAPVEVAGLLLQAGTSATAVDKQGATALHRAVARPDFALPLSRMLIDRGADVNARRTSDELFSDSMTPLHVAAGVGGRLLETVTLLLDHGARVDAQDSREETPLHKAACASDAGGVVRLLVARGANPNAPSRNGPPLSLAARCGQLESLAALIELGADVNAREEGTDARSALETAVESRQVNAAKKLLAAGADPDVEAVYYGFVPFKYRGKQPDGLGYRLTHAPTPTFERLTPLHLAVSQGDLELVRALLDKGARTDLPSHFDGSALDFAVWLEQYEIAGLLVARGARAMLGDSHLIQAASAGNARQVDLLLRGGANPDARSSYLNQTPLHCAAQASAPEVVERLLRAGADPSLVDAQGRKPVELATTAEAKAAFARGGTAK